MRSVGGSAVGPVQRRGQNRSVHKGSLVERESEREKRKSTSPDRVCCAASTRWTRTPLAGTQRPCCAGATYREPRAHAADNHVAWVQRNGVRPWACAQAWPSIPHSTPAGPLLANRRRPCLPRSPPGPAHPPQLSTLRQMLAALKNVLARPDAPWSCRSSICPPASPARQFQRPAPSAQQRSGPARPVCRCCVCPPTTSQPLLTHLLTHLLAYCLPTCPVDAKLRNCKFRKSPADPSAPLSTVAPFNAHPPLTLVPALPIARAPSRVHSTGFATHQTDWFSAGLYRSEIRPLTVPNHHGSFSLLPAPCLRSELRTEALSGAGCEVSRVSSTEPESRRQLSLGSSHSIRPTHLMQPWTTSGQRLRSSQPAWRAC